MPMSLEYAAGVGVDRSWVYSWIALVNALATDTTNSVSNNYQGVLHRITIILHVLKDYFCSRNHSYSMFITYSLL